MEEKNAYYKNPDVNFVKTKAYLAVRKLLLKMDVAIRENRKIERANKIMPILLEIQTIIQGTTLSDEPTRYANKAMVDVIEKIEALEPENMYLAESFGNKIRMDYGTGHELNFLLYLYEKMKKGEEEVETIEDVAKDIDIEFILDNIWFYMGLVQSYIHKFNVEPAGAKGCWSLNDFSLLGIVFGSSVNELKEKNYKEFSEVYNKYKDMWQNAMACINKNVKFVDMLEKTANSGNIYFYKMYIEDVLEKHVVTQHFIFSKYFSDELKLD